jgi:hypothetical protein
MEHGIDCQARTTRRSLFSDQHGEKLGRNPWNDRPMSISRKFERDDQRKFENRDCHRAPPNQSFDLGSTVKKKGSVKNGKSV